MANTLAGNGEEENVRLRFTDIKDFEPEQVARQIPNSAPCWRCVIYYAISNPICLITPLSEKSLRPILKDPALSQELRDEMSALAPK